MTDDIRVKYDALCYAIFSNVATKSKDFLDISFKGFDAKNEEHLCVLAVTAACIGILQNKSINLDCGWISLLKLKHKYRKTCDIFKLDKDDTEVVDIKEMLDFMRESARELCGEDFTFADIYREYYKGDKR